MKTNLIGISGKIGSGKDTMGNIIQMLTQGIDSNTQIIEYVNGANITGFDYQIKKYADKLKDIVCLLIGCTREQLEDREFKEKELGEEWWYYKFDDIMLSISDRKLFIQTVNSSVFSPLDEAEVDTYIVKLTPRKLLQLLGTEAGRQIIHPNVWVNALFADYVCDNCGQQECPTGEEDTGQIIDSSFPNWIITDVRFPNEIKAIQDRGGIVIRVNRDDFVTNSKTNERFKVKVHKTEHPSETALDDYEFDHVIENDGSIEDLIDKVKQLNLI